MIRLNSTELADRFNEYGAFVLNGGYLYDLENKASINACIEVFKKEESGLLIVGNPGSGKTLFFEMMQKILPLTDSKMFVKISVLDVVLQFNNKEIGHGVFRKWQDKNVFFDDLGTEDKGYLFGEKVEVFEKFIQFRYDLYRKNKLKTHFTTNLSTSELNNRYGLRCASRLNEMCVKVFLGEKSNYTDRRSYRNFIELPQVSHPKIMTKEEREWYENYELAKKLAAEQPQDNTNLGLGQRTKKRLWGL